MTHSLRLARLILRRDRVRMLIWIVCLAGMCVIYGNVVPGMYQTDAERAVMAETLKNPAMMAMMGPVYEEGGYTAGALFSNMMLLWVALAAGIMNIFHVVRHTRQDEERGRIEVIRSLPVGRQSSLAAAIGTSLLLNTVLALVTGFGLFALKNESMGLNGSMVFGAAIGATGFAFAIATALFCQLCSSSATATSLSFGFLGLSYVLRAAGDMNSEVLACLTPLGLSVRVEAYTGNRWWPVWLMLGASALVMLLTFYLCGKRDMGEGLIPARPGRRFAAKSLLSPVGLALRLTRASVIIWGAALMLCGAAYGSIMGDYVSFFETNEMLSQIFAASGQSPSPEDIIGFLMMIMSILGVIPVLSFMLKARSQERGGYAENILSRAVSRNEQLSGYYVIALASSILMPLLVALGFWGACASVMDAPPTLWYFVKTALTYLPAIWFMLGVAMLLMAFLPKFTALVWAYIGYSFLAIYMGRIIDLPEWMSKLTPFSYILREPGADIPVTPLIVMALLFVAMSAAGFMGYRRRDTIGS